MLSHLTRYLLQYRTVTIPHVGTLQLEQYPAQLNVADKIIQPPSFSARLIKEEEVPQHQLVFLQQSVGSTAEIVLKELRVFGDELCDKINGPGFFWEGVGQLDRSTQSFTVATQGLLPVPAERVLRTQPDHQVLVGDRQTSSLELADEKNADAVISRPRAKNSIAGWVLLAISVLAIALLLYAGKLKTGAAGSRLSPAGYFGR